MLALRDVCFTPGRFWLRWTSAGSVCLPRLLFLLQYFITYLLWLHPGTLLRATSPSTTANYNTAWRGKKKKNRKTAVTLLPSRSGLGASWWQFWEKGQRPNAQGCGSLASACRKQPVLFCCAWGEPRQAAFLIGSPITILSACTPVPPGIQPLGPWWSWCWRTLCRTS